MVPWCGCMSDHLWLYEFITLPPVYAELSSIILSCQYFVKTVVQSGSRRIIEQFCGLTVCVCCIAVNMTKPHVIARSFIWFHPLMLVEKSDGWYSKPMKVMNGVIDRASIEIGRDGTVPVVAVQHGLMCCKHCIKYGLLNFCRWRPKRIPRWLKNKLVSLKYHNGCWTW